MQITSPAVKNNAIIPDQYTCNGADINPPLQFSDLPADTASLTLILTDPDAPNKNWVHWIVFNISPNTRKIEEDSMPEDASLGITDFGKTEYGGPCPSPGTGEHHYHFTLYALDTKLDLEEGAYYEDVIEAMDPHVLDTAELIGLYKQ